MSGRCTSQVCSLPMLKKELRRRMREKKRQFTQQQLDELSLPIVTRLKERLGDAQTILSYASLPDEVDTRQLNEDLVGEGRTVLLPKVLDGETMELRRYTGRQDLQEGPFHIMEPVGECFSDYSQIDVALIPGMAFDLQGHRLGRGKGYYDRFLSKLHNRIGSYCVIGVCFDFQKVEEVPTDEYDVPVDEVI